MHKEQPDGNDYGLKLGQVYTLPCKKKAGSLCVKRKKREFEIIQLKNKYPVMSFLV